MANTTPRLKLPYPQGGDAPPDVAQALLELSERLDAITMSRGQGPFSERPAAGTAGQMYWATDRLEMYFHDGDAWTTMGPAGLLPIGGVLDWPAATAPPGPATWLELNGGPITRAEYPELFGAWNLSGTNANLPDRRGRSPMGAGQGPGLRFNRVVGTAVGEEEHQITKTELPNYQLTVSDPGHAHWDERMLWADDNAASPYRIHPTSIAPAYTAGANFGRAVAGALTGVSVWLNGGGAKMPMAHASLVTRYFVRAR
jgi:microcystin-dependent protein